MKNSIKQLTRKAALITFASSTLLLGACASKQTLPEPTQQPAYGMAAYADFNGCKEEGLALDASAREQGSPAQYLAAANTLDQCLQEADGYRDVIPQHERMQVHALTVLDYIKGGDAAKARLQLRAFTLAYPNKDLFFDDYTSFVDSMSVLLAEDTGHDGTPNINKNLKSEMNRNRYWQTH